jgi:hypothetical protein
MFYIKLNGIKSWYKYPELPDIVMEDNEKKLKIYWEDIKGFAHKVSIKMSQVQLDKHNKPKFYWKP